MFVDKTGSNITSFKHLFLDGEGTSFRRAITNSFLFASNVVQSAKRSLPDHKLGLWDQAVQFKLVETTRSEPFFVNDVELLLEKEETQIVWQYGISITKANRNSEQRLWTLPDGIIKASNQIIALELDHGRNLGKWANQLFKAVRSLASNKIDGVIYCFCLEQDLHPSGDLLDTNDDFTDEFQALLKANLLKGSLGIITISPCEWKTSVAVSNREILDFFESMYISNNKMSSKSREMAKRILTELKKRF